MAADDDPEDEREEPGIRRACTLQPKTLDRLRKIKNGRWYGGTVSKVMTAFIEAGIRQARAEGMLGPDD